MEHESTEARRVLFISYSFPPNMEMGAYACAQIARYLPLYGWEPVVLTVKEKYVDDPYIKRNAGDRVSDSDLVIRTHKLPHLTDIYRQLKSRIKDPPLADSGLRIADLSSPRIPLLLRRLLRETGRLFSIRNPLSAIRNRKTLDLRGLLLSLSSVPDKYSGWL